MDKNDHPIFEMIKNNKSEQVIKSIICNKNIINIRSSNNELPLQYACKYKRNEIATTLLNHGADKDGYDTKSNTPLITALKYGAYKISNELLNLGVNVNIGISSRGRTPLQIAVIKNKEDIVKRLLENGADPEYKLRPGDDNAITIAKRESNYKILKMLQYALKNKEKNSFSLQQLCFATCINENIKYKSLIPQYIARECELTFERREFRNQKFAHAKRRLYIRKYAPKCEI